MSVAKRSKATSVTAPRMSAVIGQSGLEMSGFTSSTSTCPRWSVIWPLAPSMPTSTSATMCEFEIRPTNVQVATSMWNGLS